jgi:hypothetical protein
VDREAPPGLTKRAQSCGFAPQGDVKKGQRTTRSNGSHNFTPVGASYPSTTITFVTVQKPLPVCGVR